MSIEQLQAEPLQLSRRELLSTAAAFAARSTFEEKPEVIPIHATGRVEVVVANIAFAAPLRPDGLVWSASQWATVLEKTTYEGLEAHRFETEQLRFIGAPLTELIRRGMVSSFHQSVRSDRDTSFMSKLLPGATESIGQLHSAQEQAGRHKYPIVVFPQAKLHILQQSIRDEYFSSLSAQPEPSLFNAAGVRSLKDLREWLAEKEIKVCWPTFHYQEAEEVFGSQLGNWQDVLPEIAQRGESELGEIHLEIGRVDGNHLLGRKTMVELIAFINGAEEAAKTTSGQMLLTIFNHIPSGDRPRLVVEINQTALLNYLGGRAIWPLTSFILESHRREARTVRDLASS